MTTPEKARELVNMYYGCNNVTQQEAIEMVERILLTRFCQQVDDLHSHVCIKNDYDMPLIISSITRLKWQQELALELQRMKQ